MPATLFNALLSQHSRQLSPTRYSEPMIAQLQSFFEEVVLEHALDALVVESLPLGRQRNMREIERVRSLGQAAKFSFFNVSPEDELMCWFENKISDDADANNLVLLQNIKEAESNERFILIADAHFSALLVAVDLPSNNFQTPEQQVIYTFDPDIVYTALEYLQARLSVEHPAYADVFMRAIHQSMPKSISMSLMVAVTTKLANLWQEQTAREIAVNRISTAIRQSLELDQILQTAVNEVGTALNVKQCALLVESEDDPSFSVVYFREELLEDECSIINRDLEVFNQRLRSNMHCYVRDGVSSAETGPSDKPQIVVPLSFLNQFVGVLSVQSENQNRIWQKSDLLLLQTVADQVAIAIKHARLYIKSQKEALRDSVTGAFNRRFFELQLEREFKLAQRKNSDFALIMLDIDKFKKINDTYGHQMGDRVLRATADALAAELRAFDTVMRYGGEEFAVILPQAGLKEAMIVAERLRRTIETLEITDVRKITASFGISVYPDCCTTTGEMLKAADEALYEAKRKGRNRVCMAAKIDNSILSEAASDESLVAFTN